MPCITGIILTGNKCCQISFLKCLVHTYSIQIDNALKTLCVFLNERLYKKVPNVHLHTIQLHTKVKNA